MCWMLGRVGWPAFRESQAVQSASMLPSPVLTLSRQHENDSGYFAWAVGRLVLMLINIQPCGIFNVDRILAQGGLVFSN